MALVKATRSRSSSRKVMETARRREGIETKRLINLVGWLICGIVILPVLFILTASFLGWHFDVVPTRSMEPAFNPGGMVITRPVELEDITIGDPILFRIPGLEEEARMVHRVIEITRIDDQILFRTKGDANEYPDLDLVSSQHLIGKTILYVPYIGNIAYLSRLYETPIAFMGKGISMALLLITAIGLTAISTELLDVWEWTFRPHVRRRQDILKKRKDRLRRQRKCFN